MITVKPIKSDSAWELDVLGVPYGGHDNGRDSDAQYFDETTQLHADKYGLPTATVYHSLNDDGDGLTESVEYVGKATGYKDKPDGRWYRVALDKLSPSAAKLWEAAKAGVLSVSSGTASHLSRINEATGHIKEWPVFEIAMIHGGEGKEPANKYAIAVPLLKAYGIELETPQTIGDVLEDGEPSAQATVAKIINDTLETEVKMSEETQAPAFDMEALGNVIGDAVKSAVAPINKRLDDMEETPAAPIGYAAKATVEVVDEADRQPAFNTPAEFYGEVMKAQRGDVSKRMLPLKSNMTGEGTVYKLPDIAVNAIKAASGNSEAVPADGGFLVGSSVQPGVVQNMHSDGEVLSRVNPVQIGQGFNGTTINAIDETKRTDGYRWGGVQGYWLAEADEKTKSKPTFRQMEMKLKKVAALVYATDELLQDTTALASVINSTVPAELRFQVEDAIINGSGVGKPLGILNSGALVTVAKESGQTATTIVAENIVNMWARRSGSNHVWFVNRDVFPQLIQLSLAVGTAGGSLVFMPPGGLSGSPYGSLLGAPVVEIEHAQTLGTVGDIILADMSQYAMINKGGIDRAESMHVRFVYDESVFRFVYRVDGQPVWSSPLTPAHGTNTISPFVALATRA